jgi:hypothetical protein
MPFEDLIKEIEAHEQWLAGLDVEVAPPNGALERTRERVRLAIDEAWLAERAEAEPSAEVLASVKRAVAAELAATGEPTRRVPPAAAPSRLYGFLSSLSAAAVLMLAAGLGFWSAFSSPDRTLTYDRIDDLVAVMGRDTDDEEAEWDVIESELTALESAFAQGATSTWDSALFEGVDDEIDTLMQDDDLWSDEAIDAG